MAVSKFSSAAGGNDFNINVGSAYSVTNFTQEYAAGSYSFTSAQLDITMDVYAYNAQGTLVGYTNGKGLTTSGGFIKMVIIGGTVGDVLSFTYKTTYYATAETNEPTAGPVILSTSPTYLSNVNSSTTVTGLNFATDVAVTFTGSDNLVRNAKSVVRGSVNSLVVTRPDSFPTTYSPYTMTATNPSVAYQPTGSNANSISVTAGVVPIWSTTSPLPLSFVGGSYSNTLSATDADAGSSVTYSIVSGSLPTGLSLNTSTGVINGTPASGTANSYSITVRATDGGGNTADRVFSLTVTDYSILTFTAGGSSAGNQTISGNGTSTVSIFKTSGSTSPWNNLNYTASTFTAPFTMELRKNGPVTDDSSAYAMGGIIPPANLSGALASASTAYSYQACWYPVATNGGLNIFEYTNSTGSANNFVPSDSLGANYTSGDTFRISVAADGTISYWHGSQTTVARAVNKGTTVFHISTANYSVNATNGGFYGIRVLSGYVWNGTTQSYVAG
jgi:hypothetical protein